MMTPDELEVARAWAAEPDFRWHSGMLTHNGYHVIAVLGEEGEELVLHSGDEDQTGWVSPSREHFPHTNCPSNLGWFQELVRQKRGGLAIDEDQRGVIRSANERWSVAYEWNEHFGPTQAATLLAAYRG